LPSNIETSAITVGLNHNWRSNSFRPASLLSYLGELRSSSAAKKQKTKTKKSSNGWKLEATFPSVAASISSHLHISRRYLLFCFLFFFFPFIFFLVFYCVCACSAAAPIVLHV
jgi:hypothetical protein